MRPPDLTITLDLPPKTSHANARPKGWQGKVFPSSKYAKTAGEIIWGYAAQIGRPQWTSVIIRPKFMLPAVRGGGDNKPMDPDNLISWIKKPIDLLQEHGILANDRDVIYLPPIQMRAPRYVLGQTFKESYLQIDIWQRRDGECPFCGHKENGQPSLVQAACP